MTDNKKTPHSKPRGEEKFNLENNLNKEELFFETGFNVQIELETLKSMLAIAENLHNGHMPALKLTQESIKKSVKELCEFFCNYVDCL